MQAPRALQPLQEVQRIEKRIFSIGPHSDLVDWPPQFKTVWTTAWSQAFSNGSGPSKAKVTTAADPGLRARFALPIGGGFLGSWGGTQLATRGD